MKGAGYVELQCNNAKLAPACLNNDTASIISSLLAIPVEQINGFWVLHNSFNNTWLVKSAEATLYPDIPYSSKFFKLSKSNGVQSGRIPFFLQ